MNCRNCKFNIKQNLFSLGKISFTGKFPKNKKINIPKKFLNLSMCDKCKLVQLDRNFNKKYLYGDDYGYRTGLNKTMTNHVKSVVRSVEKNVKLRKDDYVLDIGSNDGTMLNFYKNNLNKVGIDPIIYKFKKNYKKIKFPINSFFNKKKINQKIGKKKFKVITALSMFYDLENPNKFLKDIKSLLDKNGIFILEHADLLSIIKNNIFDTICHEHLEYYSSNVIFEMAKKNKLRVFNHKYNNINGGSSQYFICHVNSKLKDSKIDLKKALKLENKYKLKNKKTFYKFIKNIDKNKKKILKLLINLKDKNKSIHGYGASTKGNVLLQYFGIGDKIIDYISERNPQKFNCYTPGTKIKIISEKKSRSLKPDYYLVLPWHFKDEILKRENKARKQGTKFIFPLPKLEIR